MKKPVRREPKEAWNVEGPFDITTEEAIKLLIGDRESTCPEGPHVHILVDEQPNEDRNSSTKGKGKVK
jgi:hypothetical protein